MSGCKQAYCCCAIEPLPNTHVVDQRIRQVSVSDGGRASALQSLMRRGVLSLRKDVWSVITRYQQYAKIIRPSYRDHRSRCSRLKKTSIGPNQMCPSSPSTLLVSSLQILAPSVRQARSFGEVRGDTFLVMSGFIISHKYQYTSSFGKL